MMLALTFQVGEETFAIDIRDVCEVVPDVPLERPAGAAEWLAGLLVFRGAIVPVVELSAVLSTELETARLSTRIIIARLRDGDGELLVGLRASRVTELRELPTSGRGRERAAGEVAASGRVIVDDAGVLNVADLRTLLPAQVREQLSREFAT